MTFVKRFATGFLVAACAASAQENTQITAVINKNYAQMSQAFENKDLNRWSSFYDRTAFHGVVRIRTGDPRLIAVCWGLAGPGGLTMVEAVCIGTP